MGSIDVNELTRAYESQLGVSVAAWFRSWPTDSITHVRCNQCNVEFFHPSISGDSSFYSLLTGQYPTSRWDFSIAASFVQGGSVADIGCGPGHFLKLVQGATRRVGNDLNPEVEDTLTAMGVEPLIGPMTTMNERFSGEFHVATAFHVLEHLEKPSDLFETARAILRPGGMLIVSVPNAARLIIDRQVLPLDWPPHHLTRWTPEPLRLGAESYGFSLETMHFEPTHASYRRLGRIPGPIAIPIAALLALLRGGHINWNPSKRRGTLLRSGHALLGVFRRT